MAKRSEVLDFIADCLSAGRCNVVSDKKQNEWIGQLSALPIESFPAILEQLKKLKRRPKNFPLTCLRIYRELPVIELKSEVFNWAKDHEVKTEPTGYRATHGNLRGVIARLLIRLGI